MTDNRIPCPSFDVTLFALVDVATENPEQTARHAYYSVLDTPGGQVRLPHDLTAHVLSRLDAPIAEASSGTYEFNGTKRWNSARLPSLWNRLFTSLDYDGDPVPYDGRFTMFWGMKDDRGPAEDYLVYALLDHVQRANDRNDTTWRSAAHRGIKTFRTFLNSPTSGFLVQTHGAHEDLRQYVDTITATALADLKKK
ncbi:hypothetical protein SEA_CELAENA_24 [Microbacterium phage Celaena]|uniref:hypothetical protein n=1 Tax=Microbacterium phage Celaena TaxID=2591214 RepID=UPI0011621824|nr:hypothetical protein QDW17_gp24 [Microbacterium phage Celaena]QDH92403.1 hypothetical protein SEA_CELAENA_24 [Microbacterium phage Celaena]